MFDERVLRTLLSGVTGKAVSGGYVYRGVVSHKRLGLPPTGDVKDEIHWSLWTDAKGLPLPRLGVPPGRHRAAG